MPDNIHRVGVTGTRTGLSGPQYYMACKLLSHISKCSEICPELHFGDCVGADMRDEIERRLILRAMGLEWRPWSS